MNIDFSIQEGTRDVMVWCRTPAGRKVCVAVVATRHEARLFIERTYRRGDTLTQELR
jgi:hypothetical protein